jgi:hypothetical protein
VLKEVRALKVLLETQVPKEDRELKEDKVLKELLETRGQ